jgi:hypothetical protein
MLKKFKAWVVFKLKWAVAGKELMEYHNMRQRAMDVKYWCSGNNIASVAGSFILDQNDYPRNIGNGAHGTIEHFRATIERMQSIDEIAQKAKIKNVNL